MITIQWRMPGDQTQLKIECADTTAVWNTLCKLEELFNHTECGVCHKTDIKMNCRFSGGNPYYEWRCQDEACQATLQAHQYNKATSGKDGLYFKWDDKWAIYKKPDAEGGGSQPPI